MVDRTEHFDVIVIGAGPAGCSAAALLAERGWRVAILEKEPFPRYRIGESLIPYCWFPLDRLGLVEKLDAAPFIVKKNGVQFVTPDGEGTTPFYFFKHTDHACARTWQVVRSEFDVMLLENAVEKGAILFQETTAKEIIREDGCVVGVIARDSTNQTIEFRATLTIDASGRDTFAIQQNDWRIADADLKKIAIWTYFRGAKRASREVDEGATTVAYLRGKAWFWYIPLPDDAVSVGIVADREYLYRGERNADAIFDREVLLQPWIKDHLDSGDKISECSVTGDYSFRAKHCAENGLVLAGDAFSFLDPVFSSGVFLALQSGVMVADAVHDALSAADVSADRFAEYGKNCCDGLEAMRRLVFAFYDTAFSFGDFLSAHPESARDLTDCLIGNVEKDLEPLFAAIAEFVELPKPLEHGMPAGV